MWLERTRGKASWADANDETQNEAATTGNTAIE
jgi:hypothetical protein